jgi:hypothetical protein
MAGVHWTPKLLFGRLLTHSLTDPHTHRSDLVAPKKEREGEEEEEKCGFNMFSNAPVMAAFWVTLP